MDAGAPGPTYDGLSWTTAYTTVQGALDVANNPANATTIYEMRAAAEYARAMAAAANAAHADQPCLQRQPGQLGGGMFNSGEYDGVSSPTLSNVTFSGNQANYGGGMVNYTENGGMSSPTLSGVTFGGNHANYGGGGMANMGVSGVSGRR